MKEQQQESFKDIIPVAQEILAPESARSIRRIEISENKAIVSAHFTNNLLNTSVDKSNQQDKESPDLDKAFFCGIDPKNDSELML